MIDLQNKVPPEIWNATMTPNGPMNVNYTPAIGETVNFGCPGAKILSDDKDNFNEFDNKFSLLCTVVGRYKEPFTWPQCKVGCSRQLPAPPAISGLQEITPNLEVRTGKMWN